MAINAYTINVFSPLNTLGGVYNGIVQSITDLGLLVELLRLVPDVQDKSGATDIPVFLPSGRSRDSSDTPLAGGRPSPAVSPEDSDKYFRGASVEFESKSAEGRC